MNAKSPSPEGLLPMMPLSEALTSENRNRPTSIYDAKDMALVLVLKRDGWADMQCHMPKDEAARALRRIARSLEADHRRGTTTATAASVARATPPSADLHELHDEFVVGCLPCAQRQLGIDE